MKKHNKKRINRAFSLLELSIVILIISIFISGIMYAGIGASNIARTKVTTDRIKEIYNAFGSYLSINGRMPCPAPITDVKSSANYGNSRADGLGNCNQINTAARLSGIYVSSNLIYGMLPVQDLKLSFDMAEDGFGSKFAYIVDQRFTGFRGNGSTTNNFSNAPATKTDNSNADIIRIQEAIDSSNSQNITSDAAFVIISYGANKFGAYLADSSRQNSRSTDSHEQENDLNSGSFDSNFFAFSKRSDVFDDIVFYKTKKDIIVDFSLYSLVTCKSSGTNSNDVYIKTNTTLAIDLATWPEAEYGQIVSATNKCLTTDSGYNRVTVSPTKKCGAFGIWNSRAVQPCN